MNRTQLERAIYFDWLRKHRNAGTQYFLHKRSKRLYKLLNYKEWDGWKGVVKLALFNDPLTVRCLTFETLRALSGMEVLAYASR